MHRYISLLLVPGNVGVFVSPPIIRSGDYFTSVPHGSIVTSVTLSHQFICVTTLSEAPNWYYNESLVLSKNTSNGSYFTILQLQETGNYTCSVNSNNNYTITLTTGLV